MQVQLFQLVGFWLLSGAQGWSYAGIKDPSEPIRDDPPWQQQQQPAYYGHPLSPDYVSVDAYIRNLNRKHSMSDSSQQKVIRVAASSERSHRHKRAAKRRKKKKGKSTDKGSDYWGAIRNTMEQKYGRKHAEKVKEIINFRQDDNMVAAYARFVAKVIATRSFEKAFRVLMAPYSGVSANTGSDRQRKMKEVRKKKKQKSSEEDSSEEEEYLDE